MPLFCFRMKLLPLLITLSVHFLSRGMGKPQHYQTNETILYRREPCTYYSDIEQYISFIGHHFVCEEFYSWGRSDWEVYLQQRGLCGRKKIQSFLHIRDLRTVINICSEQRGYIYSGNLCISMQRLRVHVVNSVYSMKGCSVQRVKRVTSRVVVACNRVRTSRVEGIKK